MTRRYLAADLFCGAGGSSTGAKKAVRALGGEMVLVAVNHWPVAVETHRKNHPSARHYCVDLDAARPEDLVPEGRLDLLIASPECTFFSRARGGKPMSDQRRMSAWHVQRWATALNVRCILIENVPEFIYWGPLLPSGKPDPARKGAYFQAWVKSLRELGYDVAFRVLNAADFGDATTRRRFFLQARKDGRPIRWPEPTHSPSGSRDLFGGKQRWRAAREIIDWQKPGRSLLDGKGKPLSLKTRLRIARGLQRFGGALAPLYIALLDLPPEEAAAFQIGDPTGPEPFVLGQQSGAVARSVEQPIPTVATAGVVRLAQPTAEPFITVQRENDLPRSIDAPLQTISTSPAMALVHPFIAPYYRTSGARAVDEPLPTVTTHDRFGLCQPLVAPYGPKAEARSTEQPLPTILTRDRLGLATPTAEPFFVDNFGEREGQAPRVRSVGKPLSTVTSRGAGNLVDPVIVQGLLSHQAGKGVRSVEEPLFTITTGARMGLAEPTLHQIEDGRIDPRRVVLVDGTPLLLDIRFRMLSNRELARAMGFDDAESEYEFVGTAREITRQIGNAVPVNLAKALVLAALDERAVEQDRAA